jgi:hypothetical protein
LRFSPELELILLNEAVALNPFTLEGVEEKEVWQKVGFNTVLTFGHEKVTAITGRTAKDRVNQQIDYFCKENWKNTRK